ncbi:MAG: SoxR reducing system RseC family protein [Bacillota bacterium]
MIEYGRVVAIHEGKADIIVNRHSACGDCGACHVGKNQMEMRLTADNNIGAEVGDQVEINLETVDFLSAVLIMYGLPLIALMLGIFTGYYTLLATGFSQTAAQGSGALLGLVLMAVCFYIIKLKESAIKGMKKYRPVIISIKKHVE